MIGNISRATRRLAGVGAASLAAVVALAQPVSAGTTLGGHTSTTTGTGVETMVGVPFSVPPLGTPCAHYTGYNAVVTFPTTPITPPVPPPPPTSEAVISSGPGVAWDEGPDGTHQLALPDPPVGTNGCDAPITAIGGFSYTLPGVTGCTNVPAKYTRIALDLTVTAAGTTSCPVTDLQYSIATANVPGDPVGVLSGVLGTVIGIVATLPPPVGLILSGVLGGLVGGPVGTVANPVSLCSSPIAPSVCVIGPPAGPPL